MKKRTVFAIAHPVYPNSTVSHPEVKYNILTTKWFAAKNRFSVSIYAEKLLAPMSRTHS